MSRSPHRDAPYWPHSDPTGPGKIPGNIPATADADPCPGSCNRAWRTCAHIDVDGRHLDQNAEPINPVLGQPVWCRPCQEQIKTTIGQLPVLVVGLWQLDLGRLALTGETDLTRHANLTDSPSGSPAWDAIDEIIAWAGDLEDRLRHHLRHAPTPADHWHGDTLARGEHLTGAVRYLTRWCTALLSAPFAVTAGREALHLAARAEKAAGSDPLRHRLPAPCLSCDRRALVREDGSETVECAACHRRWTWDDYQRLAAEFGRGVRMGAITA